MILAIVGSRDLNNNQIALAYSILDCILNNEIDDYYNIDLVISGGAKGIDQMVDRATAVNEVCFQVYQPEGIGWHFFRARNKLIAQDCDRLISIRSSQSKTYGSGWTADEVERLGKPVWRITI